jgi:hypothetical protein
MAIFNSYVKLPEGNDSSFQSPDPKQSFPQKHQEKPCFGEDLPIF